MLQFNQLEITKDRKYLIIDVSVIDDPYYENVYIENIKIDNQDTYSSTGVSSTPIYTYSYEEDGIPGDQKRVRVQIKNSDLFSATNASLKDLLFVYATAKGTPAADTPCGMDNETTMGVVVDVYPYYQQAMEYVKELADTCNPSQNFADYILRLKGLELAVKTGNYPEAIKIFNKYFKGNTNVNVAKGGCGCGNS